MKKRLLSILIAICLIFTTAPAIYAAGTTMNESEFRNAIEQGGTVTMTGDVTLSSPLSIDNSVIIDGTTAKYSIKAPSGQNVFNIASDHVILQNLIINTSGNGYGIHATGSDLTVTNCDIYVANRGINFYPKNGNAAQLNVTNTNIYNSSVSDYDNNAMIGDSRGIATGNVQAGKVTISESQILGFGYSLNAVVAPDPTGLRDGLKTEFNVTNSIIKGWTALNLWSANTKFNFTNCTLVGINTSNSAENGYATISANDGIYGGYANKPSVITIRGGKVVSKQFGNALQTPFSVDRELQTEFKFEMYRRKWITIDLYTTAKEAYLFTFYPGVDGNGYMASSKIQGLNEDTVLISAFNISSINNLSRDRNELNFDLYPSRIAFEKNWKGGDIV